MAKASSHGPFYVSMVLRDDLDEDGDFNIKSHLIPIRLKYFAECDHKSTVCTCCAHLWHRDHLIRFDATIGGRRLRAMLTSGLYPIGLIERPTWAAGKIAGPATGIRYLPGWFSNEAAGNLVYMYEPEWRAWMRTWGYNYRTFSAR
jgi:hypothetical protein